MATVYPFQLLPENAVFMSSAFPALNKVVGSNFPLFVLDFDAAADEAAFWKLQPNDYGSGNVTIDIEWYAENAMSGNVVWEAQFAAITPNTDSQDVTTDALATLNYIQDAHLGTTSKRVHRCSITLSNLDSLANRDDVFIRIARDANSSSATDDMANDAAFVSATLSWSNT
jgi:hypothetical protein